MTLSAPPEQTLREPLDRPVEPPCGASFILTLPEAVWELSLGIYLIAKGFKPSPILYDGGPRAGVDDPLMPVLAAPDVAVPLVAAP
jgi:hypothetical protein